jgi:hypothetical protein
MLCEKAEGGKESKIAQLLLLDALLNMNVVTTEATYIPFLYACSFKAAPFRTSPQMLKCAAGCRG